MKTVTEYFKRLLAAHLDVLVIAAPTCTRARDMLFVCARIPDRRLRARLAGYARGLTRTDREWHS